jgi:hypothetical protein
VRDVQSGPPLGPSRSKGSEAGCRLWSGSSSRSQCPRPRFVRAAGRRRSAPNGDSRRVGVAESSRSTRARRGRVDVSVGMFGGLLGSKRHSKPSRCQIGARRCVGALQRHPAGSHSPGRPDLQDQLKHPPRSVPANRARPVAGQTPSLRPVVDEVSSPNAPTYRPRHKETRAFPRAFFPRRIILRQGLEGLGRGTAAYSPLLRVLGSWSRACARWA